MKEAPAGVGRWKTPATFFPWKHVQQYINLIDAQVYHAGIAFAQELFLNKTRQCPKCARSAPELFWVCVTDPGAAWDAGKGRVGFLTLCKKCKLQVDFIVDPELTEMEAEQWRQSRTLSSGIL
jgi:hypothetical protein